MNMKPSMRKFGGSLSRLELWALALMLLALASVRSAAAATLPSYIPTATPTATSILFTNGATSISPGRVATDKVGNVFYVGHVAGSASTLYEIPATSPTVAVATPTPLLAGLGQVNANSAFVDAAGTLWVSNGNGSGGALIEIPASNGLPNVATITGNGSYSSSTGLALSTITTACNSAPSAPCVWSASSIGSSLTSLQISDVYSDGSGNVYLVDASDSVSGGAYNRVIKFSTSAPGAITILADNLASNVYAQVTVAGDGKVYYCDSVTGHTGGGLVSLVSSGALTTVGNLASTALTLASTAVEVTASTGITTDPWGNLIISGATQISEIPLENGVLTFADEFTPLVAITGSNDLMYTNNAIYGGTFDVHGNYYYASTTNIMLTQIGGYNFGKVNVGTEVTTAAPYINITWNVPSYLIASALSPTASPSGLSTANAAYLQSFPYSGNKNYFGGTPYGYGQVGAVGQYVQMYFQPVHAGLLRGSFSPPGYPIALGPTSGGGSGLLTSSTTNGVYTINLQGVGVGPQPMFLPGTASKVIALSQLYTASSHATLATSFAPQGVAIDTYGDILVADSANGTLDIDCLATTSTVAGAGTNYCQANGAGYTYEVTGTTFTSPAGVVLDGANSAYVLDSASGVPTVTKFSFNLMSTPFVVVPSGTSVAGTALSGPKGITIDGYSNLYIADTGNNRIIQAHLYNAAYSQNIVYVPRTTTFGGVALNGPTGLGLDSSGNLFIADTGNSRIVEYSVAGVASVVSTTGVTLVAPTGVKVLPSGVLVVTDTSKGLILVANGTGSVLTTGSITLTKPQGLNLDLAGNIYIADSTGAQVVELNINAPATMSSFPNTLRGSTSSQTSLVYNSGTAPLIFSAVPTLIDNSVVSTNDFAIDAGNGCIGTTSLAVAGKCSLIIDFTPSATADLSNPTIGSVTLADNLQSYTVASGIGSFGTTGSTQKVALSGQATVNATLQPITFTTTPTSVTWSSSIPPITLSATGGASGHPVIFSIVSGGGTLSGTNNNTLTLTAVGSTVIAASQAGGTVSGILYADGYGTQTITVNPIGAAATPAFSVAAGTYTSTQTVSITDSTSGSAIYYTIDGTTPTTSSTPYTVAITVATTTTVNAIAVATGYTTSAVGTAAYTIAVPTPTFSLAAGTYTSTQTVSISDTAAGAAIYYTLDGTTPSASSTVYTKSFSIGATATVQAIAIKSGYAQSAVASAIYTLTPDFTIALGKQTITIANNYADFQPITITPLLGFSSAATLSCSGLPVNVTCVFSAPAPTPTWPTITTGGITTSSPTATSGTAATSTVFIQANEVASARHSGSNPVLSTAALAALLCFFGFRKRNRLMLVVLLVLSAAGVGMLCGCGSAGIQGNATRTSTITVTGTSGTTVHSATFSLVVTNI
ncbi:MAG: chitobiase/beta-hexosaminidase C-terminal domain-containing protein [Acidobacteriaceae bacterium]|nr:chitobiase/beta-hexosaminidase C-terminal domain-containing protein [Acidobacteriaceae bacterium]